MRRMNLTFVAVALIAASISLTNGQVTGRNSIPETVQGCYRNTTAYNRFTRLPMHIETLISIIRKIEDKTDAQWDIRRISRILVNRYMFDGMMFTPGTKEEFSFNQRTEERAKSRIIKEMIPMSQEELIPDYILDNDEKCALHWMLSSSLNATLRDEEINPYGGYNPGYGSGTGTSYGNGYNPGNTNFNNNNNNNNNYDPYNNNNNNNNNNYNNNNPPLGYNRGKRDTGDIEINDDPDFADDFSSSEEDDASDVQDTKTNSTSATDDAAKSDKAKVSGEVEYAVLPNGNSGSSKSARQQVITDNRKRTRRPIETGVVYTKWGSVAAGRVIAGIAAGLERMTTTVTGTGVVFSSGSPIGGNNPWSNGNGLGNGGSWGNGNNNNNNNNFNNNNNNGYGGTPFKSTNNNNNNNGQQYPGQTPYGSQYPQNAQPPPSSNWGRRKRQVSGLNLQPLDSVFAATLAGDAGQAAIFNAIFNLASNNLPNGVFNDSLCPREYILYEHTSSDQEIYKPNAAWTYLTEAQVRGGVDGFILGSKIRQWDPSYTLRLSDILAQYYSENGIAGESNFRSCDRSMLLTSIEGYSQLKEQTRSFAYLYNNRTEKISLQSIINNPQEAFERIVDEAFQRAQSAAGALSGIGPGCVRRPPSTGDMNDNNKFVVPTLTMYTVLDQSATIQEIEEQKRFVATLAYELEVSPAGSRLGVVDGNGGNIVISPNWTDSSPILACKALGINTYSRNQDYARVLRNMKSEIEKLKNDETRNNYTDINGIIILLMVQGQALNDNQKNDIRTISEEITDEFSDVSIIATSSKFSESDFEDLGIPFVQIKTNGNFSDAAKDFLEGLMANTHGTFKYATCDPDDFDQEDEHLQPTNFFLTPGTIQFFKISPNYFFASRSLVLRFTSDNGRVRVCMSRDEWRPTKDNEGTDGVVCEETSGTFQAPGSTDADVEFKDGKLKKPCSKNKRNGCKPIYLSVTPTEFKSPGQVGLDCSVEGCQASNQVKVTFTHWGMRCGAMRTLSSTIAIITAALALLNWLKST